MDWRQLGRGGASRRILPQHTHTLSSNSTQPSVKFLPLLPPNCLRLRRTPGSAPGARGGAGVGLVRGGCRAGAVAGAAWPVQERAQALTLWCQVQSPHLRVLLQHMAQFQRLLQRRRRRRPGGKMKGGGGGSSGSRR